MQDGACHLLQRHDVINRLKLDGFFRHTKDNTRFFILCNGAGNFSIWLHRFWRFQGYGTQLAPTSGSLGYGLPAAVGAKRLVPERTVVCFAGDGDFMMHGQELATAVQYELPIAIILLDNGMYGTIRMHQERNYPARVFATGLKNPDFCALAQAYGAHGERVEHTEAFAPALARAMQSGKPALIHCLIDPQAITPTATLDSLRAQGLATARAAAAPATITASAPSTATPSKVTT